MLNRRDMMISSGAAAMVAATPVAALAGATPMKVDNVTAAEVEVLHEIDRALDNMILFMFNEQEIASTLGMVCPAGTTMMQIRFALHDLVLDWHDPGVIGNIGYVNAIADGLDRRSPRLASKIVWLHGHPEAAGLTHAKLMHSGDTASLRAVARALDAA
jgi:hypothetical protein